MNHFPKFLLLLLYLQSNLGIAQMVSSRNPISETISANYQFSLVSVSYDGILPNLRGESYVVDFGTRQDTIYSVKRSFDLYKGYPMYAFLSMDGNKIGYFNGTDFYSKENEENKQVTFYEKGNLVKAYSAAEFTKCKPDSEKCNIFYANMQDINHRSSSATTISFRNDITEKERFANENSIFNVFDTIYVIDSRKKVTIYDLNNLKFIDNNIDLDSIYSKIKSYKRIESSIGYYDNVYVHTVDLENSLTGEKLSKTMENMYNYKYVPKSFESKYYTHKFIIDGYLNKNGKFEILKIDADSIFDKRKIENYIKNSRFKSDIVPKETKRIFIAQPSYAGFQSFDEKTAALVTKKEKEERYKKYLENFDREEIKGFYIPKNLLECMLELDKQMKFSDKEIVKKAHSAFEFNGHMDGFGIWIRNNWGINSSSRLLKYFNDRGIGNDYDGNEEISELIIEQYIKWLNGDKESSKRWEKQNPVIQNTKYRTINEF